jgi:glycine oxidase
VRPNRPFTVERTERGRKIQRDLPPASSYFKGSSVRLARRTAPALAEPASRLGAHDANDEVDDQPDDRDPNREAEKKQRESDQTFENAEHGAEEEKPQHGQRADREYGAKHLDELLGVAVSITRESAARFQPDVIVVGGGLIGLTCATAIARNGLRVLVISSDEPGAASAASAGILAPSVGHPPGPARDLGVIARDMYPPYVQSLALRTGIYVALDRSGVLALAFTDDEATRLRSAAGEDAEWIDGTSLHDIEPGLASAEGGTFHREDGAVDAAALLNAVIADARQDRRISLRGGRVVRVILKDSLVHVELATGPLLGAPAVIVAAGAWVSSIAGLPRPLPVVPIRGQILAFAGVPIRHVVMTPRGYVVSRDNRSLIGSTMERVGFDARTTEDGAAQLRASAREISPDLAGRPLVQHWAGLRPVTPDFLPLVGAEPECDGLFYACGHSRNGVLLAPLTARVIAELITGGSSSVDVTAYAPDRFGP